MLFRLKVYATKRPVGSLHLSSRAPNQAILLSGINRFLKLNDTRLECHLLKLHGLPSLYLATCLIDAFNSRLASRSMLSTARCVDACFSRLAARMSSVSMVISR